MREESCVHGIIRDVEVQRMAVALEDASVCLSGIIGCNLAHGDVCHQRGIHIITASGIFNLLAERRPVLCCANLEVRRFQWEYRLAKLHTEHYRIIYTRARELYHFLAGRHLVGGERIGSGIYGCTLAVGR